MLDIKDAADVTADVVIHKPTGDGPDGKPKPAFVVEVRCVTRAQIERLTRDCHGVNQAAGFLTDEERDRRFNEEHQRRAPDLYIKGWRGLTTATLAHLGIALGAEPETDADGTIPYTAEHARQLWTKAYADRFLFVITQQARNILEAEAARGRDRKND